jgi:hypothetical protein
VNLKHKWADRPFSTLYLLMEGYILLKIPEGFILVPINPTIEMLVAIGFGGDVDIAIGNAWALEGVELAYTEMLKVAPKPDR